MTRMICPLCELDNPDGATVCEQCGKQLAPDIFPDEAIPLLEGHLGTQVGADDLDGAFALAALDGGAIPLLDELEPTPLADPKLDVPVEPLELDDALPGAPGAESVWSLETPELDSGRSEDRSAKTPAPDERGPCPWCGFPGSGAVCNNCGRRRKRYTSEPEGAARGTAPAQTILCPACFTRVLVDARCAECLAPLPRLELI